MKTILGRSLFAALFCLSACGGGGKTGSQNNNNNSNGSVTLGKVCAGIAETICAKTAECAPPADPSCAAMFKGFCCSGTSCDTVVAGKSEDALQSCLDAIDELSCTDYQDGHFANCN